MIKHLLTVIFLIVMLSCNNNQTTKIERDGQPEIYGVTDTDAEMNEAMKTANQTLEKFNEALISGNPSFESFALKTRFNTPNGGEHIWVSNILLKGSQYFGIIDNLPESTTDVKLGDTIQIKNDNISDWMYIDNRKLRGAYTVRVLRNRMTETERKQFDVDNGLNFEE